MELLEVRVRKVGNALGVIFPKAMGLRMGQKVLLSVLPKRRIGMREAMGSIKHARPFVREHEDRVI